MSVKAIIKATTGDSRKIREEIEKKYDDALEDSDIIILANAVANHLLGNMMDAKVHSDKVRADGGWAEHLRKKGMLPEDLEDVFGENLTPPPPVAPAVATVSAENIEAIKRGVKGDTQKIRAEIEKEYKEELGSADRIILANAIAVHLYANTMDAEIHAGKVAADGGWAEHLRKKGMLPIALEDTFGANITPPPPAPSATPAEPANPTTAEAIGNAKVGDSRKIREEIENEYKEELGSNDRTLLANAVANHLLGNIMDPQVHADKVKTDGGWAEHLRKKGMLPLALEDSFGKNITPTTPAPVGTPTTNTMMDMNHTMPAETPKTGMLGMGLGMDMNHTMPAETPITNPMSDMNHIMPMEIPLETQNTISTDTLSQYQMMYQLL